MKPMLAATLELDQLDQIRFPVYASPKLDGVRAIIVDGVVMSRSMKPIPNRHVQKLFGRKELDGLDGELIVGSPTDPNLMQQTTSGVMSQSGEPDVWFLVFDCVAAGGYADRLRSASARVDTLAYEGVPVECVLQLMCTDASELVAAEAMYVEQGYEGLMVRSPDGHYKQGRSTFREGLLMKVKRFADGEAVVIGVEEQETNLNEAFIDELGHTKRSSAKAGKVSAGVLGCFLVRDVVSGVEFSVGSGLTRAQREALWKQRHSLPGKLLKYKSFQVAGVKEAPRFPTFVGFRDPIDM